MLQFNLYKPELIGTMFLLYLSLSYSPLLFSGYLDAKTKDETSSRQDESEWIAYRNVMNEVVLQSGIERARIFDIRGNHDKYGVPYVSHELDFFSKYSVNAELNRTADIYSISLLVCSLFFFSFLKKTGSSCQLYISVKQHPYIIV